MSSKALLTNQDYELLSAFIDGELEAAERETLQRRLNSEPVLQEELDSLRRTVDLIDELPAVNIPRDFVLTETLLAQSKPANQSQIMRLFPQNISLVASLILIFFGAYFVARQTALSAPVAMPVVEIVMADLNAGENEPELADGMAVADDSAEALRARAGARQSEVSDEEEIAEMAKTRSASTADAELSQSSVSASDPPFGRAILLLGMALFFLTILANRRHRR